MSSASSISAPVTVRGGAANNMALRGSRSLLTATMSPRFAASSPMRLARSASPVMGFSGQTTSHTCEKASTSWASQLFVVAGELLEAFEQPLTRSPHLW